MAEADPIVDVEDVLGVEHKVLKPPGEYFSDALICSLAVDILQYVKRFRMKDFVTFLNGLQAVAEHTVEQENMLTVDRKAPSILRQSRLLYHRASIQLRDSLESLLKAERLLELELANELRPGLVDFQKARNALLRLAKIIGEIEVDCAVMVHPGVRTKPEKRLADKARWKFGHPHLRITEGSAQRQYEVTAFLLDLIAKFSGGKVPPGHVDNFILTFFRVALGLNMMTKENVKTMRLRLKRSQHAHSARSPEKSAERSSALALRQSHRNSETRGSPADLERTCQVSRLDWRSHHRKMKPTGRANKPEQNLSNAIGGGTYSQWAGSRD